MSASRSWRGNDGDLIARIRARRLGQSVQSNGREREEDDSTASEDDQGDSSDHFVEDDFDTCFLLHLLAASFVPFQDLLVGEVF